jgi:hypothetical protein
MQHENQDRPTPRDEISSIAGRILGKKTANGLAKVSIPDNASGLFVSVEAFNSLLADAKALAGFVLEADPKAGPNNG